jgi:hypothetical protein
MSGTTGSTAKAACTSESARQSQSSAPMESSSTNISRSDLNVTKDVVCDECNQTWMNEVTTHSKATLESVIRYGRPMCLTDFGIVTVAAFVFMKTAVLDWGTKDKRKPYISRSACIAFRRSLTRSQSPPLAIPEGFHIWLWHFLSDRQTEARTEIDEMEADTGPFKGYKILVISYAVGHFLFQVTFPKWMRRNRNRPPSPMFRGDTRGVLFWPDAHRATWPPTAQVSRVTLESFQQRFRRVLVPRGLL